MQTNAVSSNPSFYLQAYQTLNAANVLAARADNVAKANLAQESGDADDRKLREAFDNFVGETFFHQMLKSMRKTVGKSPYFNGGRAEEVFTSQLDQVLAEQMTAASADKLTGPMYELFTLQRR